MWRKTYYDKAGDRKAEHDKKVIYKNKINCIELLTFGNNNGIIIHNTSERG